MKCRDRFYERLWSYGDRGCLTMDLLMELNPREMKESFASMVRLPVSNLKFEAISEELLSS